MKVVEYTVMLDSYRKDVLSVINVYIYNDSDTLSSPENIRRLLNKLYYADKLAEEYAWLLALDAQTIPKGIFQISHGTVNSSFLSPREVFLRLLLCGATSFVVVHNHPSGIPNPSTEDKTVTQRLKEAGELLGIRLLDHIIIGEDCCYSFLVDGKLNEH